jgi:hypothetical protein
MRALGVAALLLSTQQAAEHPVNTWVKRTPLAETPVSPRLGYEGDCVWYAKRGVVLRYGGHNQGGGGEQGSEVWTFDPATAVWKLHEPNTSPPGVCCVQQNAYDPLQARYVRFPSFSGSHGWQWQREIYLNNTSVWTYDLDENRWRNLRPVPTPSPSPLRCAAWDGDHDVIVMFGGEGNKEGTVVYDPYTNTWTWMKPSTRPEFRSGGQMVYDEARKLHILFGAQFTKDEHTWAYDLRKDEWRDLRPPSMPFTGPNDAVLAYDAVNEVVLAIVKKTEGKDESAVHALETWAFDAGKNEWKALKPAREPDPSGNRARDLMFIPERNLAILENCTSRPREQQVWTYRYAGGKPPARAPLNLRAVTSKDGARLSWQARGPMKVYRGTGEVPWKVEFREIGEGEGSFEDKGLAPATLYHYRVGRERARSQPRIVEDVVVSVLSAREIEVAWKPSAAPDVTGYHVERAAVEVLSEDQLKRLKARTPPLESPSVGAIRRMGPFRRITEAPVPDPAFTDRGIDLGKQSTIDGDAVFERTFNSETADHSGKPYRNGVYAYRVRAVNALGVESGPSAATLTIPSAPQWVFAQEEGASACLKWAANPEKGLRGYRVYRMDGRFDKEPVSRLTEQPIAERVFTDGAADKKSRRYYIVAVDALGQEGHPSAPAWYEREWKAFYKPFTGEWHQ